MKKTTIIIGAGASGLMSAINIKTDNNEVIILERNSEAGKKILATGNGRCNYWNSNQDLSNYNSKNKELLKDIITEKNCHSVLEEFNKLGIIPKIKSGYYYPSSNQATSIRNALLNEIENKKITIKTNSYVEDIDKNEEGFLVKTSNETLQCDYLIIATGGKAAPKTGSDGIGYSFASKFNHTIINPLPALVQLRAHEKYLKTWAGVRTDVKVYLKESGQINKKTEGEIQLTDYGVSGICIYNLSSEVAYGLSKNKKEELVINFLPFVEINPKQFLEEREKYIVKSTISSSLEKILNYKLVKVILEKSNIKEDKYYKDLTEEEKNNLIKNLTNFTIEIRETNSFKDAQTTAGGIPLTEINIKTMESHLVKNLYFTGEILDVNGICGGYNLGFAWISGILAGRSISNKNDKNT